MAKKKKGLTAPKPKHFKPKPEPKKNGKKELTTTKKGGGEWKWVKSSKGKKAK